MQGVINKKLPSQNKNNTDTTTCPISNSNQTNLMSNNTSLNPHDQIISSDTILNVDKEILIKQNKAYFHEYKKQKEKNELLKLKLHEVILKKNKYKKCLNKLQQNKNEVTDDEKNEIIKKNKILIDEILNVDNDLYINKKRIRKTKSQLIYKYECAYKDCGKKYASQGSLNQHIKLKHH